MYKKINLEDFRTAFSYARPDSFSYDGLEVLYNYLEDENIELDVVELDCTYTEYKNFEEVRKDFDVESMEELEEKTNVIKIDDESFIIQQY